MQSSVFVFHRRLIVFSLPGLISTTHVDQIIARIILTIKRQKLSIDNWLDKKDLAHHESTVNRTRIRTVSLVLKLVVN